MDKRKFSLVLSSLIAVLLLTVYSCQKPLYHVMKIQLVNGSSSDIHMWTDGESIDPSNKLGPGSSRTIEAKIERKEDMTKVNFKVYAGQNGQTLTSRTFETESILVVIRYTGGTLVME